AHTWNAGVITKDATCKEAGVKTYTCTVCGTTKTEAIAKTTTHTWNAGVVTKAATCKEAGVKTYTCTVCGATKTEAIAKTTAHTWDGGKVTKEATETAAGVKTYTCTVCGATRTEPIPQLPTEVKDDASGITVTYDPGTYTQKITVKVVETAPPAEALPADYEKTYSVDISTYIGDREVEPNAPVTVAVPVPEGFNANTLAVYHIKDDGTVEKVAFTVKDGMIVFTATGFSVYVVADTSTEIQTPAYTCGDVDGNGKIEAADARLALRQAVGLETYAPGSREFLACDADGDGSVKAADARLILRAAVGLESLDKKQGGTAA
ncbi:MAG: dockerin type I repeat-containing protein, partial [Clostridia bacterium]|nr:dockerin type I repeat-containing protein [Clostridia bacterium]